MDLKQYLPSFYLESNEVVDIQDALSTENYELKESLAELERQLFASTCTWAIDLWEEFVGITGDTNQNLEIRKKAVIAMLSGQGTSTKELITSICERFANSKVEILENNKDCSFTIKFTTYKGIPPNLDVLSKTIDKIKPAYLGYVYEYLYNNHKFLNGYNHEQLGKMTHDRLRDF